MVDFVGPRPTTSQEYLAISSARITVSDTSPTADKTVDVGDVWFDTVGSTADITYTLLSETAFATFTGNNTYTKNQAVTPVSVTLSGTAIATDASLSNTFTITLTANATLSNPTNLKTGGNYTWIIKQGGTGSMTLSFDTYFAWSGGTAPTLTTTVSAIDTITAIYNGSLLLSSAVLDIKVPA